jgi:hypothetical protein
LDEEDIAYGGPRNPDNTNYIFDAKVCPGSGGGVIGLAWSNGCVGALDVRESSGKGQLAQSCHVIRALARDMAHAGLSFKLSHATCVSWDSSGSDLVVSLGSGGVAVLDGRMGLRPRCYLAAHRSSCFGAAFLRTRPDALVTWSGDGVLNTWAGLSTLQGVFIYPQAQRRVGGDYSVYSCCVTEEDGIVAGGGGKGGVGFMGVPIYVLQP